MRTPRQQLAVAASLVVLVGLLLRAPALALPLGPADADLAQAAASLAGGEGTGWAGRGPLVPLLLALPVAAGVDAVTALRVLGLLAGAAAPALLLLLAGRWGLAPLQAGLAGLLFALQPTWVLHAGGAEVGSVGLGLCLVLWAWRGGRGGATASLLALVAEPALWPFTLLWALSDVGERRGRWMVRGGVHVLAAAAACAHVVWVRGVGSVTPEGAVLGLVLVGGLVLLPVLLRGVRRLVAGSGADLRPRAFAAAALLQAGVAAAGLTGIAVEAHWDGLGAFAGAAAGLALLVGAGLRLPPPVPDRRLALASLTLLLPLALWAALGPTQHALMGERAPLGGRLHALGVAARWAAREAGPEGWVALDLGDDSAAQARALEPFLAGRPLLVTPVSGGAATPPAGWPPGGPITLALLSVRPESGAVTTLGGWGIFAQEPVGRSGAYYVQRIRRP